MALQENAAGERHTGAICKVGPNWGFIKCDDASLGDMFIIPQTCHNWGREIPPVGTRVSFHVVTDGRTGRPRADGVEPANDEVLDEAQAAQEALVDELLRGPLAPSPPMDAQHGAPPGPSIGRCEGVVQCERGTFGFIKQDNGESDMFVLPPVPPVGARVAYDVVQDPKTGRPRAENVQVLSAAGAPARGSFVSASPALRAPPIAQRRPAGAGSYGAAQEMSLDEVMDSMSGMSWDQMQDLTYEDIAGRSEEHAAPQPPAAHGRATGTVASINASGTFGFIAQDSGEADMFALPPVPPVGTRVSYDVVQDAKTGRPRAENVTCSGAGAGIGAWGGRGGAYGGACGGASFGRAAGGAYGGACGGARLHRPSPYGGGGGRPAAAALAAQAFAFAGDGAGNGGQCTGTVAKTNGKFGFIQQDSGEADMFVFPPACEAFGRELPPVGTRVRYAVVTDQKTGRPRADQVFPM